MIFKGFAVLTCLFLGYICVKLLIRGNRDLNRIEGTPMNTFDDWEQPRSQLLKTITYLRSENENLKNQIEEMEKLQGSSRSE